MHFFMYIIGFLSQGIRVFVLVCIRYFRSWLAWLSICTLGFSLLVNRYLSCLSCFSNGQDAPVLVCFRFSLPCSVIFSVSFISFLDHHIKRPLVKQVAFLTRCSPPGCHYEVDGLISRNLLKSVLPVLVNSGATITHYPLLSTSREPVLFARLRDQWPGLEPATFPIWREVHLRLSGRRDTSSTAP